jgi:large subunit ribosomal protein L18
MDPQGLKRKKRKRRQLHVRKKIFGTVEMPRLAVFKSHRHIYCQVIDDVSGRTLANASTMDRDTRAKFPYGGNAKSAEYIGEKIAEQAKSAGIENVIFDRRSYKFHGRVKALAESARKGGLKF